MRRYVPSFCAAAACAALLYGLSARFPNPLTRVLSPVNGSPWELGKLALWPGLCAALVLHRLDSGSSRSGLCAAVLLSVGAAMALGAGLAIKNGSRIVRPTVIVVLLLLAVKVGSELLFPEFWN